MDDVDEDADGTVKHGVMYMRYSADEAPTRIIVRIGADDDDRSGYSQTACTFEDFKEALDALQELRREYPDACMRYMYNDPELGFAPYWEVDHDADAMTERIRADTKPATYQALCEGGLPRETAARLSGIWGVLGSEC